VTPDGQSHYDDVLRHVAARRRKRRQHLGRRRGRRSLIATVVVAATCGFFVLLGAAAVATVVVVHNIVAPYDLKRLKPDLPGVTSVIYDRYGHVLAKVPSVENRTPVASKEISPWLKKATVDIEDRRFYQHGGVDYQGIVRALWDNVTAGHVVQGASTIEQQLARNLYLNDSLSYTRKLREAWIATQIADDWSKDRILTEYLNIVPYGGVTYGCEAAALTYFSRHCKNLGPAQSALLAGLPQSPTDYNPNLHPRAAHTRRNEVLRAMLVNGDLSPRQFRKARKSSLGLKLSSPYGETRQPYFVQYVESLVRRRMDEGRYPKGALRNGGLRIQTTIDPKLQAAAHAAMLQFVSAPGSPSAALVSIDPRNGEILAFDASTSYKTTKYDLPAQAKRQAGSSFKPFGLMAAMTELGINPETTVYSGQSPFEYHFPNCVGFPSCTWTVNNAEQTSAGNLTLHDALDGSINAVFARLSIDIGSQRTVQMAYRLGIPRSDHLPDVYSIILGTGLVSPLDMATAYATIANLGKRHDPLAITDVGSYSGDIKDPTPAKKNPGHQVVPRWAAYELTSILKDNITCVRGLCTGGAALLSPYRPEAGKTGTVESHLDAWFCGYTPNLATCVWMGFPQGEISMVNSPVGSAGSFGGGVPAEIWHSFMTSAFAIHPQQFPAVDWPAVTPPASAYRAFTSQFPLYTAPPPPPPAKKPTGGGNGGGGNGGGGNGGGGNGGGGNGGGGNGGGGNGGGGNGGGGNGGGGNGGGGNH
jgi:penicillin-binding protein 1A